MIRPIAVALLTTALTGSSALAQQNPGWKPHPAVERAMAPMAERETATDKLVVTRHQGVFNGKRMKYRAIVTEMPMAGADGTPAAVMVSYAYVADGVKDPATRPVTFVWNGGPGASAMPLHMQAFGPRRIVGKGTAQVRLVDNEYSLLDATDLVFIDPVGTGVSMPVKGKDATRFFGNEGDAKSVHEAVTRWLTTNGRTASPRILIGESFGTNRALAVLNEDARAKTLNVDGIALLSIAFGDRNGGPLIAAITNFPTLAAVAWYHERVDRAGRSAAQYYAQALAFAQGEYATALIKGDALAPADKRAMAETVGKWLGLPADLVEKANLAPTKQQFMMTLLADQGFRTGQLDGRASRAIAESNVRPPFDDPSMTLGADSGTVMADYLGNELGYALPSEYRSLNLGINSRWNRADSYASASYSSFIGRAMRDNPRLQLFSGGGWFDITTPTYGGEFTLDHAGIPADRRTHKGYAAGHSVFEDPQGLIDLTRDMRAFVIKASAQ